MVTGASTADAAVILIDARKGVLSQTRRHATIAHLLGVRHLIVAVNKMDLVAYRKDVFDRIGDEFNAFAGELGATGARLIPVSALCADMIVERGERIDWYDGPTVLQALESFESGAHKAHDALRLPVQVLVRPSSNGDFRGYAGRIESGVLMQGAEVIALPSGRSTFVRDIVSLEGSHTVAAAGESVTVLLRDALDISRGDMLVDAAFPPRVTQNIDATVCWLAQEPLQANARLLLKHTTRSTRAKLRSLNYRVDIHTLERHGAPPTLAMNDIAHLSLTLQQPIFCDAYAVNRGTGAFILIDEASNATVAAGLIE
jgi:sulfate adenylyltransferase subunit 1